jgi:hypothetical protein
MWPIFQRIVAISQAKSLGEIAAEMGLAKTTVARIAKAKF